jgi:hypothetical protein
VKGMTTTTMESEEEIMTNQQFDAVIKMVLNTMDLTSDVATMRKAILELLIDDKTKQEYQKPLQERN